MKKFVFFFAVLLSCALTAQEVKSNISEVVIFEQGAQLERTASIKVGKGISTITLKGLSRYVDSNSLQAKIKGVKIIGVTYRLDYLNQEENNIDKKKLESALEELEFQYKTLQNEKLTIEQELKLIERNIDLKGQTVLDVADVEDFLIFYRTNLPMIRKSLLSVEMKSQKIKQEIKKIKQEIRNLNGAGKKVSALVEIEVSSPKTSTVELILNYYVNNAGWTPYYNLRAAGLDKDIELEFIGNVYQRTGVDWKNVSLTLATGTPHLDGNAPVLKTWYVNYYRQQTRGRYKAKAQAYSSVSIDDESMDVKQDRGSFKPAPSKAIISDNMTFREYKINTPYNIASNGKSQRIEIQTHKMPADFGYYTAPKLKNTAFLMAKIPQWEQYNLMSGGSKIYFEGTYVGEAYIDAENTEDTLSMSLGQDKGIVIERKVLMDKSGRQIIGTKQTKKKSFEITVKNTKNIAVNVEVVDQIPVSKRNMIKVKLVESSGASYNEKTGELKWIISLSPGESVVKVFDFEVTYPKSERINL